MHPVHHTLVSTRKYCHAGSLSIGGCVSHPFQGRSVPVCIFHKVSRFRSFWTVIGDGPWSSWTAGFVAQ